MLSSILAIAIAAQAVASPVPSASPKRSAAPAVATPAKPAASPTPSPSPSSFPFPIPPGEIQGLVLQPDGKPAAKARVGFLAVPEVGLNVPPPVVLTADEQGAFRFETKGIKEFSLRAHLPPFAPAQISRLSSGKRIRLRLEVGSTVTGDVLDAATSKPIAGVMVQASEAELSPYLEADPDFAITEAKTDLKGRFTLQGVPAAGRPSVRTEARGYASETSPVTSAATLRFRLSPGHDLSGLVTDPDGQPVAGATVTLRGATAALSARSNPAGRFEIIGLDQAPHDATVIAEGFAPFVRNSIGPDVASLRVSLEKQSVVGGRMVDEEGKPLKGAVRLRSHAGVTVTGQLGRQAVVQVGDDGKFSLKSLLAGSNVIQLAGFGYSPVEKTIDITRAGETVALGDVMFETGLVIRGRVVDRGDVAIAKARVQAIPPRRGEPVEPVFAESDAEGRFTLRGLKDVAHEVFVNATGFGALTSSLSPSPDEQILVMKPSMKLTGRVVDPESVPVSRTQVSVQRSDDRRTLRAGQTGADGRFSIEIAEPGEITVTTAAEFFERSFRNVMVDGDTDTGDIILSRGLRIRGQVADAKGSPVSGARVENQSSRQFPTAFVETDEKGAFEMRGASPGQVRLVVSHNEYSPAQVSIDLPEDASGEPEPVQITLTKGGRIEGFVRQRDGSPVAQGRMEISRSGGSFTPRPPSSSQQPVLTGADGSFSFDRLYPGPARITLMAGQNGQYASVTGVEVNVVEGETATVSLILRSTAVRGAVRRNGQPVEGLRVSVFGDSFSMSGSGATAASLKGNLPWSVATTDAQGRFALQVAGPIKGTAVVNDSRGQTLFGMMVEIPDVEEFPLDVEFGAARATGRVVDAATGLGIGEARITAVPVPEPGQTTATSSQNRLSERSGDFVLDLEPGAYRITVAAQDYLGVRTEARVSPPETALGDITLDRGGTLVGRVLLPSGRPAAGIQVRALANATFVSAMSGPDGTFTLKGLPGDPFTITATDQGDYIAVQKVEGLASEVVEIRLVRAAKIEVTLFGAAEAVSGASVFVTKLNGEPYLGAMGMRADGRGMATVAAPAGVLTLSARSATADGAAIIQVQAGEPARVMIEMRTRIPPTPR